MKYEIDMEKLQELLEAGQDIKLEYNEDHEGAFYTDKNHRIIAWIDEHE